MSLIAKSRTGCIVQSLLLSGCQSIAPAPPPAPGTPVALTDADKAAIKSTISVGLKDPYSAVFDWMSATQRLSGVVTICGLVNAKNSFGGYTGYEPFIATKVGSAYTLIGMGTPTGMDAEVRNMCNREGIMFPVGRG